jgi:transposase
MRPQGSASELERRRRRAVEAVKEGSSTAEVARVLGVTQRAVRGWVAAARDNGDEALAAKPHPGARPKLSGNQARQVLSWLKRSPTAFGFETELWSAPRIARLIADKFRVAFHPRYINEWLTKRGVTPQKPEAQPRERDNRKVAAWLSRTWPRIKKTPVTKALTSS